MRKVFLWVLLTLTAPAVVLAQVIDTQQVTAVSAGGLCSAGACATFPVSNNPSVTLQVSGTFVGTLTFEATSDGSNFRTITVLSLVDGTNTTTATAAGQFSLGNTGILTIRARATAWTSGLATVVATRGMTMARLASSGGSGGGDASSAVSSSTDGQVALYSGTGGKTITPSTIDGLFLGTSGVASAYGGANCTTQFVSALSASGVPTCTTAAALAFSSIPVSGQTTVTAASAAQALTLVAGSGMTITTDNTAKSVTFASSGGGGTPGGSNTQVQFNDSSSFGGDAGFVFDKTLNTLALTGAITGAGYANAYVTKTGAYTLTATDGVVEGLTNAFTVNLPTAVGIAGRVYTVKNLQTANAITVDPAGSETIDGVSTMAVVNGAVSFISDNAGWRVIGAAGLPISAVAQGDIPYGSAAGVLSMLAKGTALQVLRMNAGATAPEWATASGTGTVTNTGGNLTANAVVLGAGTVDTKVVAGIFTDGISKLTLGQAGTSAGGLVLSNATSGTITVAPPIGALGTIAIIMPAVNGDVMVGSKAGNTTVFANTSGTLTNGRCVQIDASGNFVQAAAACGTGGSVATDAIWDAAGDMVQGSGADTAVRTPLGTAGQLWAVNAGATAGAWSSSIGTATGTGLILTSASATALTVGPNGATNPVFSVAANVGSAATGILVTGRATGTATTITATGSATHESLTIASKGNQGILRLAAGGVVPGNTGGIQITPDGTVGTYGLYLNTLGAPFYFAQTNARVASADTMVFEDSTNTAVNLTASTERAMWNLAPGTANHATGALALQRVIKIQQVTYGFAGASTLTNTATIGLDGAPILGANATFTNTHGILVGAGAVGAALNSYGITVNAQTGATNNYAAQFLGGATNFTGAVLTTQADQFVTTVSITNSITKNDANTRTFYGRRSVTTLNTGGSNANTTLNIFSIDTVNTAQTGLTTNLMQLASGGTTVGTFSLAGNWDAVSYSAGGSAGITVGPLTAITSIQSKGGVIIGLSGTTEDWLGAIHTLQAQVAALQAEMAQLKAGGR